MNKTNKHSDAEDRAKIPPRIEGVRIIMDYTAAAIDEELFVPADQDEEMEDEEEEDDDSTED